MLKTLTIDDFRGGRQNFQDQSLLQPNQCASASLNVWAPEGGLTKAPGMVLQSSFTASGTASMPGVWYDDTVSTALSLFYRIWSTATGDVTATGRYFPFGSSNSFTDSLTPLGYTTGTISISGASLISATGSGTLWNANVSAYDRLRVNASANNWYSVLSVQDDTHLTLAAAVPAAVATGSAYLIQPQCTFLELPEASLNKILMWSTTADNMQGYDGTGVLRYNSAPNAAYLAVHKNYMFAARTSTAQSRLYWSAIKDPTSWPANNFIDVDVSNGKISGLFAYGQELIVFKTHSLYKIIGDIFDSSNPQYYVLKITTPPDFYFNSTYTIAIHSMGHIAGGQTFNPYVGTPGGILTFYGQGRIYQYRLGTTFITDISPQILRDLPTSFQNLGDCHNNADQRIQAIEFNGFYIIKGFLDPNSNPLNLPMAFILDRNMAWWYLSNTNGRTTTNEPFSVGKMAIVPSTTTRPQLVIGQDTFGKLYTWDLIGPGFGTNYYDTAAAGSSSTVAINGSWVSKEFNIEFGTFKWIVIYFQKQNAGNLTVQWSIDQAANVSYTQDMTKGRGQIIRAVIPIMQKGSTIQLTLSNNTAAQTFKVYGIRILYEESPLERLL